MQLLEASLPVSSFFPRPPFSSSLSAYITFVCQASHLEREYHQDCSTARDTLQVATPGNEWNACSCKRNRMFLRGTLLEYIIDGKVFKCSREQFNFSPIS